MKTEIIIGENNERSEIDYTNCLTIIQGNDIIVLSAARSIELRDFLIQLNLGK